MCCPSFYELPPSSSSKTDWPWVKESSQLVNTTLDNMPWPSISIVTPSYNQGQFLEETIRSILLQGYPNLEYIIIDGGSKDNSIEIIRKYEKWIHYWVSEPDNGQTHAINKGFSHASGEIVTWLNSDDVYTKGCLYTIGAYWQKNPSTQFLLGNAILIDQKSNVIGKMLGHITPQGVPHPCDSSICIPQPATFFARSLLTQYGPLDEFFHYAMDMDFWLRIATVGVRFHKVDSDLAYFRRHEDAKSHIGDLPFVEELVGKYRRVGKSSKLQSPYITQDFFICLCQKLLDRYPMFESTKFIDTYLLLLRTSTSDALNYGIRRVYRSLGNRMQVTSR